MKDIVIVATGIANVASVAAGLRRIGFAAKLSKDPDCVARADYVVLPGVGAYMSGITELRRTGMDHAIRERVSADRKTLAICLGMQLMFEGSDEAPEATGLGIMRGCARRFLGSVRVPHLGFNDVSVADDCRVLQSGIAYFANSYRVVDYPAGWSAATSDYGGSFVAAVERGAILACQFHPELSGRYGTDLLARWAEVSEVTAC